MRSVGERDKKRGKRGKGSATRKKIERKVRKRYIPPFFLLSFSFSFEAGAFGKSKEREIKRLAE